MSELKEKLRLLPDNPGVYVMLDKDGIVIYVGKARVLKNRVRQYFHSSAKPEKVAAMVENIADFYYIITQSEIDALALEKPERRAHSLRVAELAAAKAVELRLSERKAIQAALFHDCAKSLPENSPYLQGFSLPTEWGAVPREVVHQFAGAFVAEKHFGITDEEVLCAVRYHTSARPQMGTLEKVIFLADMLESGRSYAGVDELRALFKERSIDECLTEALRQTLLFLEKKGGAVYPLTQEAYEFYAKQNLGGRV